MNLTKLINQAAPKILRLPIQSKSDGQQFLYPLDPSTYRGDITNNGWAFAIEGKNKTYFQYQNLNSSINAYEECPPVSAIINRKASAFVNGKIFVLNTKGKESTTEAAKKLKKLFLEPNILQNWKQFEAQGYIYQELFGFNLILVIQPDGFEDKIDAYSMWNLPPQMVDIEETGKIFYQTSIDKIIKKITLNYNNAKSELNLNDLIFVKDFIPSFHTFVIPGNKIRPLELPINNIIGCYRSRNVLINYRGALGILSQDPGGAGSLGSMPLTEEEKISLQQDFRRYGIQKQQWQFIITAASLRWQQMGWSTKDLMLFEEIEDDIARLCDGIGYPDFLISSRQKTTFDNVNAGNKMLYQDHIIPDAENIYEQYNQFFSTEEYNIK